jgi:AcrR family transcriptional regulator
MGRKSLSQVKERILKTAIEMGGANKANVDFSTKEIANQCGISEFTLFERFGTKEGLISEALVSICDQGLAEFKKWVFEEKIPFEAFERRCLDYFLSHPTEVMFLINYSEATARIVRNPQEFERYHAYIVQNFDAFVIPYFGDHGEVENFLIWNALMRRLLMDAQFVLSGLYPDEQSYRDLSSQLTMKGLRSFQKGK